MKTIRRRLLYNLSMLFVLGFTLNPLLSKAQIGNVPIKGKIIDSNTKEPLMGVSIIEKGTTNGTISDIDGNFNLSASESSTIFISYIGYKTVDLPSNKDMGTIQLSESLTGLNEVIVVGYGVQKKSVVTAAISQVKSEELEKGSPVRIEDAMKGKVSGVTIVSNSGQPGDASTVRIRGAGTINNSDPLYIVDGMPISGGIDYLNPTDIQSIEVLKDAASAAIYGARAANGVILVTTKGGTKGKTSVSYDVSLGWQNPWKKRSVLNATQYETIMNEQYLNSGQPAPFSNPQSAGNGTDWQDEVFNYNAPMQNHQLSITGGSEKETHFLGLGYTTQEGIVGGNFGRSNYDRLNIRSNNNYTLLDTKDRKFLNKITVGVNLSYARIINTGVSTNSEWGSPLGSALMMSPLQPLYAEDPTQTLLDHPTAIISKDGQVYSVVSDGFNEIVNPVASMNLPATVNNSDKFVGNFWGQIQIIDGLNFKTSYGTDLSFWGSDGWHPPYYLGKLTTAERSSVTSSKNRGFTWQLENTLIYHKKIKTDHDFTILLGQSAQASESTSLQGNGYDLPRYSDNFANIDASTAPQTDRLAYGGATQHRLASYFGRASYNYKERYMLEGTIRNDASSNFGSDNRWGLFPSISAGWVVTREPFMESITDKLNFLKIRASWGKNGNENIDAFAYTSTMSTGNNYIFGTPDNDNVAIGVKPTRLPNPALRWEESEQTDLGFDAHLLNSALTVSFDWYNKRTNGMLIDLPIPDYVGDAAPIANIGIMENKGFEVEVGYSFNISKVKVNVSGNVSYLKNKLIDLGNATGYQNLANYQNVGTVTREQNGLPFPYFYGLKTDGIFQNWDEVHNYVNNNGELIQPNAEPGDVRFVDFDKSGLINDDDRTYIGKPMPDYTYGFTLGANWNSFDFSAFFQGVQGVEVYDVTRRLDLPNVNMPSYMLERWTGEGSSNSIPRVLLSSDNNNWISSDLYIQNGNYLRLKNLQIGYTLPKEFTRKAFVNNVRMYFQVQNLLTFTNYRGFDPEVGTGVDRGIYPQSRTITVGANISF